MIFHVRPIPSCPGYFVSDTGRVWGPRKELKPCMPGGKGGQYLRFRAWNVGRGRQRVVHHVVAEAFLGPKPAGAWVCHRNDDACDNRAENLYYGDASSNALDAFRNGGRSERGERNHNAKLTQHQVESIRRRYATGGVTLRQLGREYSVSYQHIHDIVHNRKWKGPRK